MEKKSHLKIRIGLEKINDDDLNLNLSTEKFFENPLKKDLTKPLENHRINKKKHNQNELF